MAICHGWIDSHRRAWTRRTSCSATRRAGRAAPGRGQRRARRRPGGGRADAPGGRAQVAAAKADGRWAAAYAPQRTAALPEDLAAALAGNDRARAAYEALSRSERYAIFLPLLKARTPAARARPCGGRCDAGGTNP